jgi:enoyl-CoA hydratase
MEYENLVFERVDEDIVRITLNRPAALNALNTAMSADLRRALEEVEGDDTVAVVILTGAGRAFSAGLDLKEECDLLARNDVVGDVLTILGRLTIPVIAAVNGFAITGGFELAMACDLLIAAESAYFRDTHAQANVIPGGGATQRLPRVVGEKKAKEILFASEFIPAAQAERMGFVNRVVPGDRLEEECVALARRIAAQPKGIVRRLKWMVDEGMRMDFRSAMTFEQLECWTGWRDLAGEEFTRRGREVIEKGRQRLGDTPG